MPSTERAARSGRRAMLRQIMRGGRREPAREPRALEQAGPEARRGLGAHRLGGRQRQHPAHRALRSDQRGRRRDRDRERHHRETRLEAQDGKAVEAHVDAVDQPAEPEPERRAGHGAERHRDRREAEVVPGDRAVFVAEGLEHGDLVALHAHQAREHEVEQEGGDAEEDRGQHRAGDAILRDLVGQEAVRDLILAAVGAEPAVGLEQAVEARDHLFLDGARGERSETSLKAPSRSKAGPSAARLIQSTPKRRLSGKRSVPRIS